MFAYQMPTDCQLHENLFNTIQYVYILNSPENTGLYEVLLVFLRSCLIDRIESMQTPSLRKLNLQPIKPKVINRFGFCI